jgi:S1-C subfamily serine protease
MRLLTPAWLVCVCLALNALAADDVVSSSKVGTHDSWTDGTLRLRTTRLEIDSTIVIGWGTAFGVDLGHYGLSGARYLLTAAHLIHAISPIVLQSELKVELEPETWVLCKVVAQDNKCDLCLLECSAKLPVLAKLAERDNPSLGDKVVIVGCPRGVAPCVSVGTLTDKEPNVKGKRWQAAAKFNHGNSGGPVYNEKTKSVIGVAVAGVSDGMGDMRPDTALFTPMVEIRAFLDWAAERKKHDD